MARTSSRGAAGTGTIRKISVTKDGKKYTYWQGKYTVGYDPGSGKQIQRTVTGKSQKEVSVRLRQLTTELDQGIYIAPNKITVKSWLFPIPDFMISDIHTRLLRSRAATT